MGSPIHIPRMEHWNKEEAKRHYDKAVYLDGFYNRLVAVGVDPEDAAEEVTVAFGKYHPKDYLHLTETLLSMVEGLIDNGS